MIRRGPWILPLALIPMAALAWWGSVERMQGMDTGPSVALGGPGWFTASWLLMMAAMMFPVIVPTVAAGRGGRPARGAASRASAFAVAVTVYLSVWTLAGVLTYLALRVARHLGGSTFAWHHAGRWLCVAMTIVAAVYQLSRVKDRRLALCHAPAVGVDGSLAEGAQAGLRTGRRCIASSWALMALLFALGAMSVVWMAVIGGLIALERIAPLRWWGHGGYPLSVRAASATLLLALAAGLGADPAGVPGFTVPGSTAAPRAMPRMGQMHMTAPHRPSTTVLHRAPTTAPHQMDMHRATPMRAGRTRS